MRVDYYSPVPDLTDLEDRNVYDAKSNLAGIDFRVQAQLELLALLGQSFGHECDWPTDATDDPYRFYTENESFGYGCAASTHCVLRHFRPRRVVEIGSGNSSLVIATALARNAVDSGSAEYIIVDPYPRGIIEHGLPGVAQLRKQRVELLDVSFFETLRENDVLFIDSGHTVRIGGDVNYLILDVLPRLAQGVIIHFHDIELPYEYPKTYAINPSCRQFWTEAYLLQAFLCLNQTFEVLLALRYLMTEQREAFGRAFATYDPRKHRKPSSGSFWVRRS